MHARLLVPQACAGLDVALTREQAHYVGDVLRLRAGDPLQVFDGRGTRYRAQILATERRGATIRIGPALAPVPQSALKLSLAQGIAVGEKMDWIIEKACELGAVCIVPLFTARSSVRLDAQRAQRRLAHWRRIIEAACMQCGRDTLPTIAEPLSLARWLDSVNAGDTDTGDTDTRRLLLDPGADRRLSEAGIDASRPITVLVGPESGLDGDEIARATAAGFEALSLGGRILRTETAGLATLAALQVLAGDF